MAEFLVELFVSRSDAAAVDGGTARAKLSAQQLTREGTPVRCVRSLFVPEDETCFVLYEASSADHVREAARRAGLAFERVAVAQSGAGFR
jgi:hypothetical protein